MKSLRIAVTLGLAGALALVAAAPAQAAGNTIDEGDALYAINCDTVHPDWQLFSVDSPTGVSTTIGSGTEDEEYGCAGQAAYNPATGVSYYIQWRDELDVLATIDVTTGVSDPVDAFYYNNGEFPEYIQPDALAIGGDGAAYVLDEGSLYSVTLDGAIVEFIGETEPDIYSFAWDSVTGGFYGITYLNEVFQIDVTDGTAVSLGTIDFGSLAFRTYSLQFDGAGTLWIEVDEQGDPYAATLWSVTFDTLATPVLSGDITEGGELFYTESLLIVPGTPAPALAATGTSAMPVIVAGLGLLVLGGAAVVLRRRAA